MKQEPGRDMVIYGSASIVQTLTNLGLIDRYKWLVFPIVLGVVSLSLKTSRVR